MSAEVLKMRDESWDGFIARIAGRLSTMEKRGDAASWEKARTVIDGWIEALQRPELGNQTERQKTKRFYDDLRAWWHKTGEPPCRPSFMAHARRLYQIWPDCFAAEVGVNPNLSYDSYRRMAICGLTREQKAELRDWAEKTNPRQADLRREINARMDLLRGISRPDFELKVSNHWVFQVKDKKRSDGFDGGVNAEIYANLIHSFSDPGDTVLDPFAGGGLLADTLQAYRHFREVTQAEHSGPRYALMCDIAPGRPDILQADVRDTIPFDTESADLAILDPPYYEVSNGKYAGLGVTLDEWMESLRSVLSEVRRCLRSSGLIAIMTDDVVRKKTHEPMGLRVFDLLQSDGWRPVTTIYNFNRNFTGMSGGEMARAKTNRLHVNAVKIIQVARRPSDERLAQ